MASSQSSPAVRFPPPPRPPLSPYRLLLFAAVLSFFSRGERSLFSPFLLCRKTKLQRPQVKLSPASAPGLWRPLVVGSIKNREAPPAWKNTFIASNLLLIIRIRRHFSSALTVTMETTEGGAYFPLPAGGDGGAVASPPPVPPGRWDDLDQIWTQPRGLCADFISCELC